jgi:hypothetical protein
MSHESAMEGMKEELTRTRDGGLEGTRWTCEGAGRVQQQRLRLSFPLGKGGKGKLTAKWENGWPLKDRLIYPPHILTSIYLYEWRTQH